MECADGDAAAGPGAAAGTDAGRLGSIQPRAGRGRRGGRRRPLLTFNVHSGYQRLQTGLNCSSSVTNAMEYVRAATGCPWYRMSFNGVGGAGFLDQPAKASALDF